jgi:uncharacterized protein
VRFWDSSALIPLFVLERHSEAVRALAESDPHMAVWWATPVECASAVHRLRREGVFRASDAAQILAAMATALGAADTVQAGDALHAKALRLLGVHPLRAEDALQLAAALILVRDVPAGRELVSLDERLREAALLEGFRVLPESV